MREAGRRPTGAIIGVCAVVLAGCAGPSEATGARVEPAAVEAVEGADGLSRVTLTERAVERLGVVTAPVSRQQVARAGAPAESRLVVPYGAVIYDPSGGTWVYVNDEPRSFVRAAITVEYIEGDVAVLVDGPAAGTEVASVGGAELYGAEVGIDH